MNRILVVDDDPANLFLMKQLLVARGFSVVTIGDAHQVMDRLCADPPDMILLDIMMPGKDGITLLREMKSLPETDSIPVIMVTARAGSEMLATALAAGASDYVRKPVDTVELMARIDGVLKLKQYADELRRLDQLRVVREMVGTVCHNFNQPITALRTYLNILNQHVSGEREADLSDLLEKMDLTMNELVALIEKLRGITRYKSVDVLPGIRIVDMESDSRDDSDAD